MVEEPDFVRVLRVQNEVLVHHVSDGERPALAEAAALERDGTVSVDHLLNEAVEALLRERPRVRVNVHNVVHRWVRERRRRRRGDGVVDAGDLVHLFAEPGHLSRVVPDLRTVGERVHLDVGRGHLRGRVGVVRTDRDVVLLIPVVPDEFDEEREVVELVVERDGESVHQRSASSTIARISS